MPLANDMTLLLNKIERRLGLVPLAPHLPEFCQKDKWGDIIMQDTIVTFSRYFPNRIKMIVNNETCDKRRDEEGITWYFIKDEILQGNKLLGIYDVDWSWMGAENASLGATSLGGGFYYGNYMCLGATYESILALQGIADVMSMYNRQLYIDFQQPNRFSVKGIGNTNYDLKSFVIILLIEHRSLSTISPTMMEIFERLAQADIASFLYQNLKYWDGLDTAYVNIDLKLAELDKEADKRESVVDEIKQSYVSTSNNTSVPYIWTV